MNLQNLLTYQSADVKARKLRAKLDKSPEKQRVEEIRANFNKAKKEMQDAEVYAEKIVSTYNAAAKTLNEIEQKIEELIVSAQNGEDVTEELNQLKATLAKQDEKMKKLAEESQKALKVYSRAQNTGKTLREEFNKANDGYKKKESGLLSELERLETDRDLLRKKVDEKLLARYDSLIVSVAGPVFVPAQDKMCGGCFMEMSSALYTDELLKKGYCQCDSCKRIIYKAD